MKKDNFLYIALIILLAPFFLVSIGLENNSPTMWWIGLILLGVGGLIPPTTRFAFGNSEEEEDEEAEEQEH